MAIPVRAELAEGFCNKCGTDSLFDVRRSGPRSGSIVRPCRTCKIELNKARYKIHPYAYDANSLARQRISSRWYKAWAAMKQRCLNPNRDGSEYWLGKGIKVCSRWLNSPENFLADICKPPTGKSLDRFPNPNGDYSPDNCRWATVQEQGQNRRNTKLSGERVIQIRILARTLPQIEIAPMFGVGPSTICDVVNKKRWANV